MTLIYRHLRFLNLNNTGLATWDEVDRLAEFPALKSLRVQVSMLHCVFKIGSLKCFANTDLANDGLNTCPGNINAIPTTYTSWNSLIDNRYVPRINVVSKVTATGVSVKTVHFILFNVKYETILHLASGNLLASANIIAGA